jgi:hypothetical protein
MLDEANEFKKIVQKVEPEFDWSKSNASSGKCDDSYVGDVLACGNGFHFVTRGIDGGFQYRPVEDSCRNRLILVLESPHKDEFSSKKSPLGPANGSTGINIRKLLCCATHGIVSTAGDEYDLVLLNAVQHQCSLGVGSNKNRKDRLFNACWKSKILGQEQFKDRLQKALLPEGGKHVVINCCTQSESDSELDRKKAVSDAIKETFKSDFYELNHPSSWRGFGLKSVSMKP